jgi:hypothetical protein
MLVAGSLISALNTLAGQIPVKSSPLERQNTVDLNLKRYVAAGDRAYIVGAQDGSLVPSAILNPPKGGIGWHMTGQMGGVWAHPIKLIHDFQFFLNGSPLPARVFLYPSGSASYRRNSDLEVDIFDGVCCDGIG